MSHELTQRLDGTHEMAYVGEKPWHGFGQKLQHGASIEEWQKAAGLDWKVNSAPVQFQPEVGLADESDPTSEILGEVRNVPDRRVLYRSDTHAPMSVVSKMYQVVQPDQVLEFFRNLVDIHDFSLETAGSLKDGRRIWALANAKMAGEVVKGDELRSYLLLATSYDGQMSTIAKFTPIRVVCNNTLTLALGDNRGTVRVPHSTSFCSSKVQSQLGQLNEQFAAHIEMGKELAKVQLNQQKADQFLMNLLNPQAFAEGLEAQTKIRESRPFKEISRLFGGEALGIDIPGVSGTAWGMLGACTEYWDHEIKAKSNDLRLNSAWFGNGEAMKSRALVLASELL